MTKTEYADYEAAVARGLKGLEHVSTGACPGCGECGLLSTWEIQGPAETLATLRERFHFPKSFKDEEACLEEIEALREEPDADDLDLSTLQAVECEPTERERECAEEPSFSWSSCDCCGSTLGGDRYPAHGWLGKTLVHLDVCTDCLYYLNYGQLDDLTMLEMESAQ